MREFKDKFTKINESTVKGFQKRYEQELAQSKGKKFTLATQKQGHTLLLGRLDEMVQRYIRGASNRGAVITRSVAVSTAKAVMKHPKLALPISINERSWAQSLFKRMKFSRKKATSAKLAIPSGTKKETQLLFNHSVVKKVNDKSIPESLILNFDQTPSKFVPVASTTLLEHSSKQVVIKGSDDKRAITATFTVTLDGQFLGMKLIYGGKTNQRLPRFEFLMNFSLSVNKKHYSNEEESMKFIKKILVLYIESEREWLNLPHQEALAIFDVFKGQVTQSVLELLKKHNILFNFVPANMTSIFQPLVLTVNGYTKKYCKKKFNQWYTDQIFQQLAEGKDLEEIDVKLQVTTLKPPHAKWIAELYNHMTSGEGKQVVLNGWRAAEIRQAIDQGYVNLPKLDPFKDIDPLMSSVKPETNITPYFEMSDEDRQVLGYGPNTADNDSDDEDDEIFEAEQNFTDVFSNYVQE